MIDAVRRTAGFTTGAAIVAAGIAIATMPMTSSEGTISGTVLMVSLGVAISAFGLHHLADVAEGESDDGDAPAEEEPVAYGQA